MFHLDMQYALKRNMSNSNLFFFPTACPVSIMATSVLPVAQVKNLEVIFEIFLPKFTINLSANPGSFSLKCAQNLTTSNQSHCHTSPGIRPGLLE